MAKRFRSLASALWDSDSTENYEDFVVDSRFNSKEKELQLDNQRLRMQVSELLSEVNQLKLQPSVMCHIETQETNIALQKLGCSEPWIGMLRQDVVNLPRLRMEVVPELLENQFCNGNITFDLPKNPKATASQVAQHAENAIRRLSKQHPAVFKIGLTSGPVKRWQHPRYGYALDKREKWRGMKIICVTASSFSAALLETMLISIFKGTPGCRNEKPGGETASPGEGPHFTYVVYRILTPPPRIVSHASLQSNAAN